MDFDLKTRTVLPLGLAIAYKGDSFPQGGEDIVDYTHDFVLRIAYSGTTDFLLSLDFTHGWFKVRDRNDTPKFISTLLNLRYYF